MTRQDTDLIFIVDDDPDTRVMVATALGQAGFRVMAAGDGASALALIDEARPDLVVLDAVMGGLDGFETCRRLKKRLDHAHLPVIFITGLTETEHVVKGLRAGGIDYVTKPINFEELIARIRVHLGTARLAHSARTALDVTGRSLLAVDGRGLLLWRTPQAAALLSQFTLSSEINATALTPDIVQPILALIARSDASGQASVKVESGARALEIRYLGPGGEDEFYFRLSKPGSGGESEILKSALALTARESEILVWISRGKPNRDISEILNISPRTVNKHLEQVFAKLGVENRAAAAASATRILAARN